MPRESDLVRKSSQHHVWQQYLRSWSDDGKVYCLQQDRVFRTGTPVLGVTTDFYKLPPLSEEDLTLIKLLLALDGIHPIARQHHDMVLQELLSPMLFVQRHREKLDDLHLVDDLIDTYNTNAIDNRHTAIESAFLPLLTRSLSMDISWYESDKDCSRFCSFIGAQHMRTRGVKDRAIRRLKERLGVDINHIWDILALIFGFNIGCSLFLERRERALVMVQNDTAIPFVTSDQPVINLHANGETPPEKLSFYYPLSPRLALYLGEPAEVTDLPVRAMTAAAAAYLNSQVAKASHSQVYARTLDPLQVVRNCRA